MQDPITQESNLSTAGDEQIYDYVAVHNDTVIGIFNTQSEAMDAVHGYQMSNNIDINDTISIYQSTQVQ